MSIKVTVQPKNRISINMKQQEVKSVGTAIGGATKLTQLGDVDASSVDDNETVVYDEASGKFVVKELPIIDGGTF